MTVRENLEIGGFTAERRETGRRLDCVLDVFPRLRDHLTRRAGDLSGAQQQMTAVGRGLMSKPRLLVLDEPLMGLAPAVASDLAHVLQSIVDSGELSVLLIEQRAFEVVDICERAYLLDLGVITDDSALESMTAGNESSLYFTGAASSPACASRAEGQREEEG